MNNTKNNALLFQRTNRSARFGDNAHIDREIYVTKDDECAHTSGSLTEGMLDGSVVNAACIAPRLTWSR